MQLFVLSKEFTLFFLSPLSVLPECFFFLAVWHSGNPTKMLILVRNQRGRHNWIMMKAHRAQDFDFTNKWFCNLFSVLQFNITMFLICHQQLGGATVRTISKNYFNYTVLNTWSETPLRSGLWQQLRSAKQNRKARRQMGFLHRRLFLWSLAAIFLSTRQMDCISIGLLSP